MNEEIQIYEQLNNPESNKKASFDIRSACGRQALLCIIFDVLCNMFNMISARGGEVINDQVSKET